MAVVRYLVKDVDKAITFYTEYLSFTVDERWGSAFAILKRDDLTVWLSGPEASASRSMPDGRRPEPGGWNRLVIEVDDITGRMENLIKAGIVLRSDIVVGPGGKQLLIEDPSGNPIELFEPS